MGIRLITHRTGSTGPIDPPPLYSVGVTDYSNRWEASRVDLPLGSNVPVLQDVTGSMNLLFEQNGNSTGTATLADVDGVRAITQTPGAWFKAASNLTAPCTIVLMVKKTVTGSFVFFQGAGYQIASASSGAITLTGTGTGAGANTVAGGTHQDWVILIANLSPTEPALNVNGQDSTAIVGSGSFGPGPGLPFSIPASYLRTDGPRSVMGLVIPRLSTAGERTAIVNALKAKYSGLTFT